jgi:protein SCO1/2
MILSYFKGTPKLLGVTSSNWNFLTGDRQTIFDLSNKDLIFMLGKLVK